MTPPKTDSDWLRPYREEIDALDNQIIDLLGKRFDIVRQVGALKTREGLVIEQTTRVEEVKQRNAERGKAHNLSPDVIRQIYTILIDYAHVLEYEIKEHSKRS